MNVRRYLIILAAAVLGWAALAVGAVALIDPYGVSPIGLRLDGVNTDKVARTNRTMRLYKPLDMLRQRPEIVFFGSSKTNQSIDPDTAASVLHGRTYNAAMDDGRMWQSGRLFAWALARGVPIHKAFFEVYPRHFQRDGDMPWPDRGDLFLHLYFSWVALGQTVDTLTANRLPVSWLDEHVGYFRFDGQFNMPGHPPPAANDPRAFAALARGMPHFRRKVAGDYLADTDDLLAPVRDILGLCRTYGVDCVFYAPPLHPFEALELEHLGKLSAEMRLLDRLAQVTPFVDFTGYAPQTWPEVCQQVPAWQNTGHFRPVLGRAMVDSLAGRTDPDYPPGFGQMVTADSVAAVLAERERNWRDWVQRNGAMLTPILDDPAGPLPDCPGLD